MYDRFFCTRKGCKYPYVKIAYVSLQIFCFYETKIVYLITIKPCIWVSLFFWRHRSQSSSNLRKIEDAEMWISVHFMHIFGQCSAEFSHLIKMRITSCLHFLLNMPRDFLANFGKCVVVTYNIYDFLNHHVTFSRCHLV